MIGVLTNSSRQIQHRRIPVTLVSLVVALQSHLNTSRDTTIPQSGYISCVIQISPGYTTKVQSLKMYSETVFLHFMHVWGAHFNFAYYHCLLQFTKFDEHCYCCYLSCSLYFFLSIFMAEWLHCTM